MPQAYPPNALDLTQWRGQKVRWVDQLSNESIAALQNRCPQPQEIVVDLPTTACVPYLAKLPHLTKLTAFFRRKEGPSFASLQTLRQFVITHPSLNTVDLK